MHILNSCFCGSYNFIRIVKKAKITMFGEADFNAVEEERCQYSESARYVSHGLLQNCFQQRYFIIQNSSLIIQKQNGSTLHEFQISPTLTFPLILSHVHCSKRDVYKMILIIASKDQFHTYYAINGPKKSENIQTFYTRKH